MTRSFRLTRKAEDSLVDIARWTIERFGVRQADLYETELVARCEALARGDAVSRSCAILVDDEAELRYARAGEHFVVFLERPAEILVVDFLHSRSDLPRHIAALGALKNDGSDEG
ncbi:type II toxin-antitoxin system RelE/ParE family toxin [uncultured Tateyamaria sp.]|uniref:type II toxin-antitoxin system RelE/ParE family toxin n=1 Tax=uncultured Tateyamaria sp. TaxID=455651 RepID=UPI002635C296|nr:type II toxin-antitoxin system RelE/ParE family toxin [uncultured Tateyamaria sp.]